MIGSRRRFEPPQEVWRYQGISRARPVLVTSCDELNDAEQPTIVDVTSFSPQEATSLHSVPVGDGSAATHDAA
jgi:hypothetical protein